MARESREEWAKRAERWRDSGLRAAEFAAEVGVNPWTLSSESSARRTGVPAHELSFEEG